MADQATFDFMSPELMSQFAALAARGGSREEAFGLFLSALKDAGVSDSAIEEAQSIGPKLFKKAGPTKAMKALAGNLESSQALDKVFAAAKVGAEGIPDNILISEWRTALAHVARQDKPLATRLKSVGKDIVVRAVRGGGLAKPGPEVGPQMGGGFTGGPTPRAAVAGEAAQLPATALMKSEGGPLATIAKGGAEAGEAALKAGSKLGRFAKAGAVGLGLSMLLPFGSASPLTLPFREGNARNKAVEGFAAAGATTSSEVLKSIVRQQELAARRQMTLQTYEPELFQQMLTALASTDGPSPTITDTERRIGAAYEQPMPSRRPDKDVKFLLDQLMQEMSGPL